jgi:hypothetical protein
MADQPEFEFDGGTAEVTRPSVHDAERLPPSTWREVPQALFLSWPDERQRSYCVARDRDSATYALSDEWRAFYLRRAESYT